MVSGIPYHPPNQEFFSTYKEEKKYPKDDLNF